MTRLILVRHGESAANAVKAFAGHSDFPLTDLGRAEARLAADYLLKTEKPDVIYASDFLRAYETGVIISEAFQMPLIKDEHFREIFAGDWEGMKFSDIAEQYPEEFKTWRTDYANARPVGGESTVEVYRRTVPYVTELCKKHDGECVLVATHATVIRAVESCARGFGETGAGKVTFCANTAINIYNFDSELGTFSVVRSYITDHLKGNAEMLPKTINA